MSRFILRFQSAQQIDIRSDPLRCPAVAVVDSDANKWLQALAGVTCLTSLDLKGYWEEAVSDEGLRALSGLTALTTLSLVFCTQVSDDGLRALAGLTGLTTLNLWVCARVSDDGLRALAGLTALTAHGSGR
jgi:hypothetical protein